MSTSTFRTRHLVVIGLVLTFLVGWKGAKDWVQSSSARNPAKFRLSTDRATSSFPSHVIHDLKPATPDIHLKVNESYGKLPLSFAVNQGQVDSEVRFLSRGRGYSLYLTSTAAVLQLPTDESRISIEEDGLTSDPLRIPNFQFRMESRAPTLAKRERAAGNRKSSTLQVKLVGASPQAQVEGLEPLPGKSNYFIGNDPGKWRTHVPNYSKVKYREVYPGIDLVYYGNPQQLEYDWIVSPGADPGRIAMKFVGRSGGTPLRVDSSGDLLIATASGEIRQHEPVVYQEVDGARHKLAGAYVLKTGDQVGFQVAAYDVTKPLIIDPVLVYSTYLGGSGDEDHFGDLAAAGIAIDTEGNAYLTGVTTSIDFPTANPKQANLQGFRADAFVMKLDPAGSALIYSTYLGGSVADGGSGITADSSGNAYVSGYTFSSDFPTTAGALQPALNGFTDAFVAKLTPNGSALLYSTYLGGSGGEAGYAIGVDVSGNAYTTGITYSLDFPLASAVQAANNGLPDAFVTKLNPTGSALVYSTYLGGNSGDKALGIAVDSAGSAHVTGLTGSNNFPVQNAFQGAPGGGYGDAFVTKLNPAGSALAYSTYLGGSGGDRGFGIAIDSSGNAYVTGSTDSTNFPTAHPIQASNGGSGDAFVTKLNPAGLALAYSTYLGGSSWDLGYGIAIDPSGNAYVTGSTDSTNFPTVSPIQANKAGFRDAFVTKLNATGSAIVHSTYLGGSGEENYFHGDETRAGIAVDSSGNAYVMGATSSADFPTANPFQAINRGGEFSASDVYIAKISGNNTPVPYSMTLFVPIVLSSSGVNNSFFTSELALTNRGSTDATLEFTYTAALGGGSGTASDSLPAGQQRIVPDAIAYLKSIGIPIPDSGNRGGTLSVLFSGLSSSSDAAVTVRTTTAVNEGRAGLAYAGIPTSAALTGPVYLCGLRQNASDRSNVALQNAGTAADGEVALRLTVFSGDPANPIFKVLPDLELPPGGFTQINSVLTSGGLSLSNGYVRVERLSGKSPYYAYAVINDQANSDGSFVPPISESALAGRLRMTLPVIVESSSFSSELVLTNWSTRSRTLSLSYLSDAVQTADSTANLLVELKPGEQSIIPNFIQSLRDRGITGIGAAGPTYAGALIAMTIDGEDATGIFLGARTSAPGGGGRYGLFYTAVPYGWPTAGNTWLYGLQQNAENRTNLALVNTGEGDRNPDVFSIEFFDGNTGLKVNTVEAITLDTERWMQISSVLAKYAPGVTQGYARVNRTERTARSGSFIAYAVINDGGQPGERTDDGAFLASSP